MKLNPSVLILAASLSLTTFTAFEAHSDVGDDGAVGRKALTHSSKPVRVRWGTTLDTDSPYYSEGDVVDVRFTMVNGTEEDAFGFVPISSGNGCTYRIRIEDIAGNTVWEPGSIFNGMFNNQGCSFGSTNWNLSGRSKLGFRNEIPLIYQNGDGNGQLGDALPPGSYSVQLEINFFGPRRVSGPLTLPGQNFKASVPILIE